MLGHIEDSLRQDRQESQCKEYIFYYIRLVKAPIFSAIPFGTNSKGLRPDHGEYHSPSILMYKIIVQDSYDFNHK